MRSWLALPVVVTALSGVLLACPGAQVKDGPATGDVDVVLRRIDVVSGGFDEMKVNVILAVANGTSADVDVDAALDIALAGEAAPEDTGGEGDAGEGDAADPAPATADAGLDGSRHAGRASGTAKAMASSELAVPVTLPLPSDKDVLERVLTWRAARVHVAGKVKIGLLGERTIAGERDLATPKMPELRLKNAQVAKVDDGAAGEAYFTILLENKNTFEVVADAVTWRVSIAGKELRVKEDGSTSVPASAIEEYNETIPLDDNAFPAKDVKALLKRPSVPYVVEGVVEVRGIRRSFTFNGEMQFPR